MIIIKYLISILYDKIYFSLLIAIEQIEYKVKRRPNTRAKLGTVACYATKIIFVVSRFKIISLDAHGHFT